MTIWGGSKEELWIGMIPSYEEFYFQFIKSNRTLENQYCPKALGFIYIWSHPYPDWQHPRRVSFLFSIKQQYLRACYNGAISHAYKEIRNAQNIWLFTKVNTYNSLCAFLTSMELRGDKEWAFSSSIVVIHGGLHGVLNGFAF